MAIRLQLPPFIFPTLRLRWINTRSHFVRRKRTFQALLQGQMVAGTPGWMVPAARILGWLNFRAGLRQAAVRRQLHTLTAFETEYEDLVDLLCWAAKDCDNPPDEHEARYAELRVKARLRYRCVRARLRPHWLGEETSASADPFEALFIPDSLDQVIYACGGIEIVIRTRCALDACRDELETRLPR